MNRRSTGLAGALIATDGDPTSLVVIQDQNDNGCFELDETAAVAQALCLGRSCLSL